MGRGKRNINLVKFTKPQNASLYKRYAFRVSLKYTSLATCRYYKKSYAYSARNEHPAHGVIKSMGR